MIVRTRVLHERTVNGLSMRLDNDQDNLNHYRVTISRVFDRYEDAMDYIRQLARKARAGNVSVTDY